MASNYIFSGISKVFCLVLNEPQELAKNLSGGEKNRLSLAKLLAIPSNLLLLDEPTNDLDIESIQALEQALIDYKGTIILISHDRIFLDKVVTSCIAIFEDGGMVLGYNGGFSDWSQKHKKLQVAETSFQKPQAKWPSKILENKKTTQQAAPKKKSYKLVHELQQIEKRLPQLESQINELTQAISEQDFYEKDFNEQQNLLDALSNLQHEYDNTMQRWLELEED